MNFSKTAFAGAPVRANKLEQIVTCIQQGNCCSVVGPSNTGKSFLLRSLLTEETRRHCAKEGALPPLMVFVDCLEAGDSEHAFYELLLRRTIEALMQADFDNDTVAELRATHRELLLHSQSDVAIRALYAGSMRMLCYKAPMPIVLILDEFYDVLRQLPPWPFRQLRALYDSLETQLSFVTGTSHFLEHLRGDKDVYEFRELFHLHTVVLHPLSSHDTRAFVHYLAERHNHTVSVENEQRLIALSGGHPGLLERIYGSVSLLLPNLTTPIDITPAELIKISPIQKECQRLWSELESEQPALLTLLTGGETKLSATHRALLERKGLIRQRDGKPVELFSPVFARYVETKFTVPAEPTEIGLRVDDDTGQIFVNDTEITLKLSEPQRKLIAFLCERLGVVCSYDDIAVGVWGVGEGVSPGAIYELVKRVRQKVEADWRNPRYIVTVPGKGYRLEGPDDWSDA
ncbi:MAG: winged helix-turn-helix domain-containing protein [Anaerolineae bacterium]|nr:winged helix-turn-helix domain-containing protein [Anaerolineae bacterium]